MQSKQSAPNSQKVEIDIIKETKRMIAGKNEQQRFEMARKNLFNALDYKTPRLDIMEDNVSHFLKAVYLIQTNYLWRAFLLLLAYLFMYAAFFGHVRPSYTLIGIQLGILLILFIDVGMEVYHKKFNKLRRHSSFQVRFYIRIVTLILLLADQIIALSTQSLPVRPFLILRCVLPVIYDPQIRKMLYALFSAYIDILVYLIFYTSIIIVFAIMANQFIEFPPNQTFDNFTGNYPELGKSIFIMYVLTTFDAYPDNQLVAIRINIWIYAFFIIFIFLNALFFVTIPTNVLLNSIKETRSKTIIIDEIEQQHNLIMAFIALGGDYMKKITYAKLVRFLLYIFNNQARYIDNITEICKSLDEKVDGTIQVTEFMQLCKIIQSKNYLRPPRYKLWKRLTPFQNFVHNTLKFKDLIRSTKFQLIVAIFVVLSFINCILTMYVESDVYDIIDDVIMIIIVIEVMFKFIGLGPELFFNSTLNIIDLIVVIIGLFLELAPREIIPRNAGVFIKMLRIFRITLLIRYITGCFNIAYRSEIYIKLTKLINQMGIIIPIVLKFFPLYMICFYFLGAVGVQIFWYQTDINPKDSPYSVYNQFSNFKSLLGTQFVFVQVLTEAGWSLVAYDHAYRYGSFALTMLFFVISHELIVIILTSLLKGITWQVYNSISIEQEAYLDRMAQYDKNYKILKKRLETIDEVRQKIQNQESLKPDNLISRELYEKKIDRHILKKFLDLETKNKGAIFYHKKKKTNEDSKIKDQQPALHYRDFGSLLIGTVHTNMDSSKNLMGVKSTPNIEHELNKKQYLKPESAIGNESLERIDGNVQKNMQYSESSVEIQKLKEEDIEREIDELLNEVVLHSGIKFSVKIQYPPIFLEYLKQKLKPIAISNFEGEFNSDRDVFAKQESMNLLAHGLHTLLDIRTSDREQRKLVLDEMVHRGVITSQKAKKILTEKSQYEDETKFDYDWIIRKTYLSNVSEKVINRFETEYFSAVYGESFKQINKVTVYPLMRIEARLHYCFSNLLRYRQIRTYQFFNILTHIQNKISVKLLKRGSLCKFVYQIDTNSESWFSVQLKDTNELRVHFIKNGLWIYNDDMRKDQVYVARDVFNWENMKDRDDKEESAKLIKRFYQSFQSLAFCIQDFDKFFIPQPENQIYDLYSFYRDVEPCRRLVKKQLSISKIMIVILSKQSQRKEKVPYSLSDLKYDEQQLQNFRSLGKKTFRLDQTEKQTFELLKKIEELGEEEISDVQGLPYSYLINFLINIRQIMSLNQKNFVYHVEKLLNQHFKAQENNRGQMKRRISLKPRID